MKQSVVSFYQSDAAVSEQLEHPFNGDLPNCGLIGW